MKATIEIEIERDSLEAYLLGEDHLPQDAKRLADQWRLEAMIASGFSPDQIDIKLVKTGGRR